MNYKELLKKAREELPDSVLKTERFEIPKVKGHIEGNKTIITNFVQIASTLRRDINHLLKYLSRELAAPGEMRGKSLIIGRKISSAIINAKIEKYAKEFVICPECKRPDTKLIKEDRFVFMKCLACGARHPIKSKI